MLHLHLLHRGGEKKIKVVVEAVTSVQHSSSLELVMLKASVLLCSVFLQHRCVEHILSAQETFCLVAGISRSPFQLQAVLERF